MELKNQNFLVWLVNTDYGRDLFQIRNFPKVKRILPNAIIGENMYQFRTHHKYSKLLKTHANEIDQAKSWYYAHAKPMLKPQFAFLNYGPFFPNADPEGTSVDGITQQIYTATNGVIWATIHADAGNQHDDTASSTNIMIIHADSVASRWKNIGRSIFLFDTSSIPAPAVISSAQIGFYASSAKTDALNINPDLGIFSSNPASNTALADADFTSLGTTLFSQAMTYGDWSNSAANIFTLNSSGLAGITKAGISKFGVRNVNYDVANVEPTWSSANGSQMLIYYADQAGTSNDPFLNVVTSDAAGTFIVSD